MRERNALLHAVARLMCCTALFFALPLLFLGVYVLHSHAPTTSIWPHLFVVAGLIAGLAGIRLILTFLLVGEKVQRLLAAITLSLALIAFTSFYAAVFIGVSFWGRVTTLELVKTYVAQAPELLQALGFSSALVVSAALLLILVCTAIAS